MAKRDTYGYRAELARKRADVRIKGLLQVLRSENLPDVTRKVFQKEIMSLNAEKAATRIRTKTGKIIPGRTQSELNAALERLNERVEATTIYTGDRRRAFKVTQSELNKASVGLPSQYTKAEAKIFYKATQKAWQRAGVTEHNRNEAILEYYGRTNLAAFVKEVLDINELAIKASEMRTNEDMTEEQRKEYDEAQRRDNEDSEKGSPIYMSSVITLEEFANIVSEPIAG